MVKPCILRKLVIPYSSFRHVKRKIKVDHRLKFAKYLDYIESKVNRSESGYAYLVRNYTEIYKLSSKYLSWFDPAQSESLKGVLGVGEQDHTLRKRMIMEDESESWRR